MTVSIDERISAPVYSSVTPYDSMISRWPSAVPPPWLPIAGMMTGIAPSPRTWSQIAFVMSAIFAMPRLPAVIATVLPGANFVA